MTWLGSGYAGRRFPAGPVRPGGRSVVLFVFPLVCLLVCLSFPQDTAAEEEEFTLPEKDPCFVIFEGYKQIFGERIDNYFLLTAYRHYAIEMEWWRCCPGSEKNAAKFRPKNADEPLPQTVLDIEVPAVFAKGSLCAGDIYGGIGKRWREEYSRLRELYWGSQYSGITENLKSCCVQHLNTCLKEAFRQDTSDAGRQRMRAESDRFSNAFLRITWRKQQQCPLRRRKISLSRPPSPARAISPASGRSMTNVSSRRSALSRQIRPRSRGLPRQTTRAPRIRARQNRLSPRN